MNKTQTCKVFICTHNIETVVCCGCFIC